MKAHIHPPYRTVVFHDTSANEYFKVGSTIRTDRVIELDGETFPYVTIDVSSKSHPYYTGKQKTFASEGSAARFRQQPSYLRQQLQTGNTGVGRVRIREQLADVPQPGSPRQSVHHGVDQYIRVRMA